MSYKDDCVKLGLLYKNDEYVEDVDIEDYLNLEITKDKFNLILNDRIKRLIDKIQSN